jgi:hypothetical protein
MVANTNGVGGVNIGNCGGGFQCLVGVECVIYIGVVE